MWQFINSLNLNGYALIGVVLIISIAMFVGGCIVLFQLFIIPYKLVESWNKSRGTIKILLNHSKEYSRGDSIEGKIVLDLKKPIKSNNLELELTAENTYFPKSLHIDSEAIYESDESDIEDIYFQKIIISGKDKYKNGEYPFKINIPNENINLEQECLNKRLCYIDIKDEVNRNVKTDWYLRATLNTSSFISIEESINLKVKNKRQL